LAVVLSEKLASAGVPALLTSSTVEVVRLYQAGQAAVSGAIPVKVAALTEGVLKAMSLNKIKTVVAGLILAGTAVLGGGLLGHHKVVADQPGETQQDKPMQSAPRDGARKEEKPGPAPAPLPRERKARLEITADGKQVRALVVFGDAECRATADHMSYDEERQLLILEAAGDGNVKVVMRRSKDQVSEIIEAKQVTLNRKTGRIHVQGAGKMDLAVPTTSGVRLAVPMLGPVPISLDTGFPVGKGLQENPQVFNFYMGFMR
jgi:hypothetical protein